MTELAIKTLSWNHDLVGYEATLSNGKCVQIQFEKEQNRLHADYGRYIAEIGTTNEYGLDLTDDEFGQVQKLIAKNTEIKAKEIELDKIDE